MKRLFLGIVLTLLVLGLCLSGSTASKTLYVQYWAGSEGETVYKCIIEPFQKETGIKVVVSHGLTSETVPKVIAQRRNPRLDVVFIDDVGIYKLAEEGLLEQLPLDKIPNSKYIPEGFRIANNYGLGVFMYETVIAYNPNYIKEEPTSWNELWDPKYRNKVAMQPVEWGGGYMFIPLCSMLAGGDQYNLEPAWQKLRELKPNVLTFASNMADLAQLMQDGSVWLAVANPYLLYEYVDAGYPIRFAKDSLKEGFFAGVAGVALVKNGPGDREAALKLIDYALSKKAQEGMANEMYFGPCSMNVELSPEVDARVTNGEEEYKKLIFMDWGVLGAQRAEVTQRFYREWNK
ncbi:MAG: ABC transporter substrate-binding protein [Firmicutes bacterium]|nr:ABC transporter substrate-binding protein [Bacillota bacterium]